MKKWYPKEYPNMTDAEQHNASLKMISNTPCIMKKICK